MSSAFFLLSIWPDRIIKGAPSQNHIGLIWLNHNFQHGHHLQKMNFSRVFCCGKNLGICASLLPQQDHCDPPTKQKEHPTLWEFMPDIGMVQAKVFSEHIQVKLVPKHTTKFCRQSLWAWSKATKNSKELLRTCPQCMSAPAGPGCSHWPLRAHSTGCDNQHKQWYL